MTDNKAMARALEWVRVMAMQDADGSHLPAIEEAIAAYDPERMARCGTTNPTPIARDALAEVCERLVRDAMPATESGSTCFVPRYQIDELRTILDTPPTMPPIAKTAGGPLP